MKRGAGLLIAAALVGLGVGLAYAWVVAPPPGEGTTPSSLRGDFKDQFRSTIASAYQVTGDLERAKTRLALLGDSNPVQALSAQAQRALAEGESFDRAQELARLAADLQAGISSIPQATMDMGVPDSPSPATAIGAPSEAATAALLTVTAHMPASTAAARVTTQTAAPSRTPIPSPSAPFQVISREEVCDRDLPAGLLQINVIDTNGQPLPGIEITITWSGGEERFFTGLQPEVSEGYADFVMQPGTAYSLQIARLGQPVSRISPPMCPGPEGSSYVGGLEFTLKQP